MKRNVDADYLLLVGQQLQKIRTKNKMTQNQLADRLDVKRETVALWERGKNVMDIATLYHLSCIFEVSTDYFLKTSYPGGKAYYDRASILLSKCLASKDTEYVFSVCDKMADALGKCEKPVSEYYIGLINNNIDYIFKEIEKEDIFTKADMQLQLEESYRDGMITQREASEKEMRKKEEEFEIERKKMRQEIELLRSEMNRFIWTEGPSDNS